MKHLITALLLAIPALLSAQSGKLPAVMVETLDGKKVNAASLSWKIRTWQVRCTT